MRRTSGAAPGERRRVVRRPLVHEPAVPGRVAEQNPARATGERLAHGDELRAPALDAAEVVRERLLELGTRRALLAQALEEELMQDHRIGRSALPSAKV